MPTIRSARGFQCLTVLNASWAFIIGLLTVATPALVDQNFSLRWSSNFHWNSLLIAGLLSGLTMVWAWRTPRPSTQLMAATGLMTTVAGAELFFGVALSHHTPFNAVAHTLAVMLYLALTVFVAMIAYTPSNRRLQPALVCPREKFYFQSLLMAGGVTLILLMSGVLLRVMTATSACSSWPLCHPLTFSTLLDPSHIAHFLHRGSALLVGVVIMGIVLQTHRNYPHEKQLVRWSTALTGLFLTQVGLGVFYVLPSLPNFVGLLHLSLSIAMWAVIIILATVFYFMDNPAPTATLTVSAPLPIKQRAWLYFMLIKPFILILLLITTLGGMVIAAQGMPSLGLLLATFVGGVFSAGGASVLNSYIDSDIDGDMSRTARRATVTGLVTPQETLRFGLTLTLLSIVTFLLFVNPLSAMLSMVGLLYYVFFYTMYLKRNTIHNIIIGGAAGAIPPLVGWAAITNTLNLEALYLFAIIFFWTPPHTWAMALLVEKDYAKVKVPMLPVIVGPQETVYQTFLYSVLLGLITILPYTFGMVSWLYLTVTVALNAHFLRLAWNLWQHYNKATAKKLYKYSQAYLALLFLIMAVDRILF